MEIPEDFSRLYGSSPDNHCTYLILQYLAPFGSRLVIDGEFPHCRFFNLQVSPPFDPHYPHFAGFGNAEVPIVDVDIEPDPGHTNPFRVGANRHATQRHYQVNFRLEQGNMVQLNEALNPGSMTEITSAAS